MRLKAGLLARGLGALAIACACVLVVGPVAAAKPRPPAGKVASVSVSPASVVRGDVVDASVVVENPRDSRSASHQLLLKLRAPDGKSGTVLSREQMPVLGAGKSTTLDVKLTIPKDAPVGEGKLVACRAHNAKVDACGISRATAPLEVQRPRENIAPAHLSVTPDLRSFGAHVMGTSSPAQTFTVTNDGGSTSGPLDTAITGGDSSQFTKSSDGCDGQALAAGASCTFDAAFSPVAAGAKTASAGVGASPGGAASATLSGTGLAPAHLVISPSPKDYGSTSTSSTRTQTLTVSNTGDVGSGTIGAASIDGANADQFAIAIDNCSGTVLAGGAACTVDVTFAPTSSGDKAGSLQVSAAPGGTASSTLLGTGGTPAQVVASPGSLAFGNVYGDHPYTKTITFTNTGEATSSPMTEASELDFPRDRDNPAAGQIFSIAGNTCGSSGLAGGASCTVAITFNPPAGVNRAYDTAGLTWAFGPDGSGSVGHKGTGVLSDAKLKITLTTAAEGVPGDAKYADFFTRYNTVPIAPASGAYYVWLRNTGHADAHLDSPAAITLDNMDVSIDASQSTCAVTSASQATSVTFTDTTIAGSTTCKIAFTASRPASGDANARFTFTGSPGGTVGAELTNQ